MHQHGFALTYLRSFVFSHFFLSTPKYVNEIQRSILLIIIICEILLFIFISFDFGKKPTKTGIVALKTNNVFLVLMINTKVYQPSCAKGMLNTIVYSKHFIGSHVV